MPGKGKRVSLAGLAGGPVESVPGSSRPTLVHLAPEQVAPTPLNPRQDFDPVKLEELGNSMRGGQLQPCVGIARSAYVRLFPEHADQVPACQIVMAAGERRWKAALKVGLPTIDVHVREDIAESRVKFLAAVLTENVERSNFNYIEEARGLQQMLEMSDGSQADAARELNKSKQWFSQRIGLLRLSAEMQELVIKGEVTALRELRKYSALPSDQQVASWRADREAAERKALEPQPEVAPAKQSAPAAPEARQASAPDPAKDAEAYTAVYASPAGQAGSTALEPPASESRPAQTGRSTEAVSTVNGTEVQPSATVVPTTEDASAKPPQASKPDSVPEPRGHEQQAPSTDVDRADTGEVKQGKPLPYDNGPFIAMHLGKMMDETAHAASVRIMNKQVWDKAGAATSMDLLREQLATAQQRDPEQLRGVLQDFMEDSAHSG